MADDYHDWMRLGNEYYAKNDRKAAEECWAVAEKLRGLSPADVLMLKDAIIRAVRRGD
jgi:cytochrome c-type biogenesis protein CcmH/NrfG